MLLPFAVRVANFVFTTPDIIVTFAKQNSVASIVQIPCKFRSHKINLIGFLREFRAKFKCRTSYKSRTRDVVVAWRVTHCSVMRECFDNSVDVIITDFARNFTHGANYAAEIAWHLLFWRCRFDVKQTRVGTNGCAGAPTPRHASLINLIRVSCTFPEIRSMIDHGTFDHRAINLKI